MIGKILLILATAALAKAQVPSLGYCPEYAPMGEFDRAQFAGVWYEAERYFQLTEAISRCVMANYTLGSDGTFHVTNEVTNRFTGIKRVVSGAVKKPTKKEEAATLVVKYTVPLTPETKYTILETDYKSYAVLWSCSGIGPFRAQNAWIMTRERPAEQTVLQKAYAVLDKFSISKTFFMKSDQEDCAFLNKTPAQTEKPEDSQRNTENESEYVRSSVVPDAPEWILQLNKDKEEKKAAPPVPGKKKPVNTVPELIMEAADATMKEDMLMDSSKVSSDSQPSEAVKEESSKNVKDTEKTA